MKHARRIALVTASTLLLPLIAPQAAFAQLSWQGAMVVASCGTPPTTYQPGVWQSVLQDTSGLICTQKGGGGGGGAVTVADGADITEGAKADAIYNGSGAASVVSILKGIYASANGSIPAGGNVIGGAQPVGGTGNGATNSYLYPTASDNHTVIKNGAGNVYGLQVFNNSATVNYVRLYNVGTGFNGCGSATSLLWSGVIPASTSGTGAVISLPVGISFPAGISMCVTGGYGSGNTTNATANALIVDVNYN